VLDHREVDHPHRRRVGDAARACVEANLGAVERGAELMESCWADDPADLRRSLKTPDGFQWSRPAFSIEVLPPGGRAIPPGGEAGIAVYGSTGTPGT
jgi:hypothetical protein